MSRIGSEMPILACDRYRTIDEPRLSRMLLLGGFAVEVAQGRESEAGVLVQQAIDSWVASGLGFCRDAQGQRRFDPVEVLNFATHAGLAGTDSFWRDHYVPTGRALVASGPAVAAGPFAVTLRRRFDLARFPPGARLRLRLPLPLAGAISVTPVIAASLAAEVACSSGRMEVRLPRPSDPNLELGVDLLFAAHRPVMGDHLNEAERELYLRPSEGWIRICPRIRRQADLLAGSEADPRQKLQAFWDFMIDHLTLGMVHYDQVPPQAAGEWVLAGGWYDCQLGAALLVSLCRASDIPARILSGHVLYPLAPFNHFWAEAWLDGHGWFPMDLMAWDLSAGGKDRSWRDHFFGSVDARVVMQCLPLHFTGAMSLRFPLGWHMVQTRAENGIDIEFIEYDGTPLYRDRVVLRPL